MNLKIRDVKASEKQELFTMMEDFYNRTDASLDAMKVDRCEATFEYCLQSDTYARTLVMEDENGIQGFCLLSFTWSNEAGGMVVLVEELYFKGAVRGKGYGRAFFQWVEEEYPRAKRYRLEATYHNKAAIALYEKLGFKELNYYQMIKEQ